MPQHTAVPTLKGLIMSRLSIPAVSDAPAASKPLLEAVHQKLGVVPNLMKLLGQSPAALEGYLSLSGALDKGTLDVKLRESLALAVAEFNGCDYCLAAHSYIGKNLVKLTDDEIAQARDARALDVRRAAALRFAQRVASERGRVQDSDIAALRSAGFNDAETIEIVLHVALNVLTNYVNNVARTDVDFPRVSSHTPA
ncbi:carboxymuconolactone decarboxylase family protein [Ideonella sp. DXS29W]|uniref:Carboxymuconolactone decarboxylase family protein n=1 Tax=Ideonella lacteola TaxID=2984193 RepID=A0ABU9BIL5_9BURK